MSLIQHSVICFTLPLLLALTNSIGLADSGNEPELTIRALVQANAEKDIATLSRLMAHDDDITSYTIGGRKYVGWKSFEHDMLEEFSAAASLELPIQSLKVWTKGNIAWYAMELDYIRTVVENGTTRRAVLPLRETGVLERRSGQWVLLSWHESFRNVGGAVALDGHSSGTTTSISTSAGGNSATPDLSGEWDILEVEDDKRYKAKLDKAGNGPYTQHGGRFVTTKFSDRLWEGTWQQPGNDREGGFELLLSEDGKEAKGVWWYSRVGSHKNIPPREHGGTYHWKRVTPVPKTP